MALKLKHMDLFCYKWMQVSAVLFEFQEAFDIQWLVTVFDQNNRFTWLVFQPSFIFLCWKNLIYPFI